MSSWLQRVRAWWAFCRRLVTPINTLCRDCGFVYTYIDMTYDGSTLVESCPNCGSTGSRHELERPG